MAYNPMMGLLADQNSLAPSLGLLGQFGNPGQDPIKDALAQMAAQRPQMAPPAPPALPGPATPPRPPSAPQQAPVAPPAPRPAPATRRPLVSPTQMALFSAGGELAREDAPSLAHAVSRALAAGVPAFLTSKQAQRDQEDAQTADTAFRAQVDDMVRRGLIDPTTAAVAREMGSLEGRKYLAEINKRGRQTTNPTPGSPVVDTNTGAVVRVADAIPEEPEAPLTPPADIMKFLAGYPNGEKLRARNFESWPAAAKAAYRAWEETQAPKGTRVTTNVNLPAGVDQFINSLGGAAGIDFAEAATKIGGWDDELSNIRQRQSLLKDPTFAGGFANAKTKASSWAAAFGLDIAPDARVNTQQLVNLTNDQLVKRVKELGVNPSDADLRALASALGAVTDDPRTLERVYQRYEDMILKGQERYNQDWLRAADQARQHGTVLPPNVRPAGARAAAIAEWAALTPAERADLLRSGVPDPTRRP